ncbi:MAG: hypothetical protein K2I93_03680 [Oscillospiraceae bacterium]|nr:hypothetical protein [Oscillospiraceae bacterium]
MAKASRPLTATAVIGRQMGAQALRRPLTAAAIIERQMGAQALRLTLQLCEKRRKGVEKLAFIENMCYTGKDTATQKGCRRL